MPPKGATGNVYSLSTRAQIVLLKQYTNKTNDEIALITGADPRTIQRFNKEAIVRGFNKDGPLLDEHLVNKERAEVYAKTKDPEVIKKVTNYVETSKATRSHNLHKIALNS